MARSEILFPVTRGTLRKLGFLIASLLAVGASATAGSTPCSQEEIERTAQALQEARRTLLQLPVGDGLVPDVPKPARHSISGMKAALGRFIVAYMACVPVASEPDPAKMEAELSRMGHAFSLEGGRIYKNEELPPDFGKYGFELWFRVKAAGGGKPRVGIVSSFSIECGSDAVLMVFSAEGDAWREVLHWESRPYRTVAGAFWSFAYSMSPPDSSGEWYVVTKNVLPWCSSTWSAIQFTVLRPVGGTPSPQVLLSGREDMWWGNEDMGTVEANAEDFEVRYHSSSIDSGVHNRVYMLHYGIRGDRIARIPPIAASPRDFVDEWIRLPWPQAEQWSDPADKSALNAFHRRLHRKSVAFDFGFESVHLCSDALSVYEVAVSRDDAEFYFLVQASGTFTMKEVSNARHPGCGGKNLLDTMETK